MTKKHLLVQCLSIISIALICLVCLLNAFDNTIVYLGLVALAGLGGYSVRTTTIPNKPS